MRLGCHGSRLIGGYYTRLMTPTPGEPGALSGAAPRSASGGRGRLRVLLGAAFLMATSAIGPGFLTQTALFTGQLGASFGFAVLLSVLFDLAAQLTIWRVIVAARLPAQTLASRVLPGLGGALTVLVAAGGLAFNIGNVAGAGLGLAGLPGTGRRPRGAGGGRRPGVQHRQRGRGRARARRAAGAARQDRRRRERRDRHRALPVPGGGPGDGPLRPAHGGAHGAAHGVRRV